ncbi:MAG: fructose-bisphosphate aldolase [Desulfobacterales bacterium]|nr:fructose-bisphosphate aldolase [Desulfobacterales bacterium]
MSLDTLKSVAAAIVAPQKGVLAADESSPTIKKRFDSDQGRVHREQPPRATASCCSPLPASRNTSAARSCTTRPCARRPATVCRSPRCFRAAASFPVSRSTRAPRPLALCPGDKIAEGLDGLRDRPDRVRQAGREVRQVAGGDRDRRA